MLVAVSLLRPPDNNDSVICFLNGLNALGLFPSFTKKSKRQNLSGQIVPHIMTAGRLPVYCFTMLGPGTRHPCSYVCISPLEFSNQNGTASWIPCNVQTRSTTTEFPIDRLMLSEDLQNYSGPSGQTDHHTN
jgi:hypothetical protein